MLADSCFSSLLAAFTCVPYSFLGDIYCFFANLRTGKTFFFFFFFLPVEHRKGVNELLHFLNNMEQTDLDDDSMTSRHQKLSLHLFFFKTVSPFSRHTHGSLPRQLLMNFLPISSLLFIHTELDGISQHFKTLAKISKKVWCVAEGECDNNQLHIMMFNTIL